MNKNQCFRCFEVISTRRTRFCGRSCSILWHQDNPGKGLCASCLTVKSLDCFIFEFSHRYNPYCNNCRSLKNKEYHQREGVKARRKMYHIVNKYNISRSEYETLYTAQGGGCAICGVVGELHVDHCHSSGAVRGLLCSSCNIGLGLFKDDAERLRRAADYATSPIDNL